MDFYDDIEHPYYARYNWFVERIVNGADSRAEKGLKSLCRDIKEYDLLHTACMDVVKDYDNGREE